MKRHAVEAKAKALVNLPIVLTKNWMSFLGVRISATVILRTYKTFNSITIEHFVNEDYSARFRFINLSCKSYKSFVKDIEWCRGVFTFRVPAVLWINNCSTMDNKFFTSGYIFNGGYTLIIKGDGLVHAYHHRDNPDTFIKTCDVWHRDLNGVIRALF